MNDWRMELERERFTVPSRPAPGCNDDGPSATWAEVERRHTLDRPAPCKKQRWQSEMLATNFARLVEMANEDGVTRYAYSCDKCGEWHITRQAPREDAA